MSSRNDHRAARTVEVESMSLSDRQAAISAGVIEDLDTAPDDVRAFAEQATRRYLETFPTD